MSITKYLILLSICTALSFTAWFFVLFFMNPIQGGIPVKIFFYLSLGFALCGAFSLCGYLIRSRITKTDEMAYKGVSIASRQSIVLSGVVLATLILQSQRWLTWWMMLIVLALAGTIELFFISFKKYNR
jgi:hypothetical protein